MDEERIEGRGLLRATTGAIRSGPGKLKLRHTNFTPGDRSRRSDHRRVIHFLGAYAGRLGELATVSAPVLGRGSPREWRER